MSKIRDSINIPGSIAPYDSNDTYPTHSAIYGKGGWKSVENIEDLLSIPKDRLENGCIVRVVNSDTFGNPAEYYFDETIYGTDPTDVSMSEEDKKIYKAGFKKWTPGYLPTKVSELENDSHYISEVIGEDGIPIDPTDPTNVTAINTILNDRDTQSDGEKHKGLYNELAKAYLHKNEFNTFEGNEIYGLVTVQSNGKINPNLIESSVVYVVMLEGFFPDDVENKLLANEMDETGSKPKGMNIGAKYFITGNYSGSIDPEGHKYKIAVATDSDNWRVEMPSKECIYINKARNEAYICEDYSTDLVCIGRGDIVNNLGEFGEDDIPEEQRTRWGETPLSAEMGYWLKQQIEMVFDCIIDGVNSRLDQEIEDRRNADDVIRNYTVNSIPIQQNPVVSGSNAYLTGYSKNTSGSISASDSINTAFSKLETTIEELSVTGGGAAELINEHANRKDNPHEVTRDQVGLGESVDVTFSKVTAPNGFFQSSDSRLKDEIRRISNGTGKIRLVQFRWKDTGKIGFGIIADEVEKYYPSIVETGADGYKTVNYTEALVIKISQLEDEIEFLKKELEELKKNK